MNCSPPGFSVHGISQGMCCYFFCFSFLMTVYWNCSNILLLNMESVYCVWWVVSFVNEAFKTYTDVKLWQNTHWAQAARALVASRALAQVYIAYHSCASLWLCVIVVCIFLVESKTVGSPRSGEVGCLGRDDFSTWWEWPKGFKDIWVSVELRWWFEYGLLI